MPQLISILVKMISLRQTIVSAIGCVALAIGIPCCSSGSSSDTDNASEADAVAPDGSGQDADHGQDAGTDGFADASADGASDAFSDAIADGSMDAAVDAVLACPIRLARSGEPTGVAIDPDLFGCDGACGPSCKADCEDSTYTTWTTVTGADGGTLCMQCSYALKECKSHAFCRWHDDCYRQCDLHWYETTDAGPADVPLNACYRNCDNPVAKATTLCAVDWTQIGINGPYVRDACWDGSWTVYSTLSGAATFTEGSCSQPHSDHAKPFASSSAKWNSSATPPKTLPEGYSCSKDTDCPDRNQYCQPDAGTFYGINGWGLCEDTKPSPGIDVSQLMPDGLSVPDGGADLDASCGLDYQCASGSCRGGVCVP
jgi:hypothetical protein